MRYDCYSLMEDLRIELNEPDEAYVQGTDTTGRYNNTYLLRKINQAYRQLYAMLLLRIPGYFYAKASLAGVNSVYTLPGDFGRMVEVRDSDGHKIIPIEPANLTPPDETGTVHEYYRDGNTCVLNLAGVTETYDFYYRKKSRDLDFGMASAGAATSITLATSASKSASFYIGMEIHNVTKDWDDTITAYTSGRVATIAETAAANDYYGLVPEIPDMFHHLIATKASQLVRAFHPLAQSRPTQVEISLWNDMLAEAIRAYGDERSDIPLGELQY